MKSALVLLVYWNIFMFQNKQITSFLNIPTCRTPFTYYFVINSANIILFPKRFGSTDLYVKNQVKFWRVWMDSKFVWLDDKKTYSKLILFIVILRSFCRFPKCFIICFANKAVQLSCIQTSIPLGLLKAF